MKTKLLFITIIYILFLNYSLYSQENENINLNLIKSPSSPGFAILGIEPTSVERPADPNSFKLSILNATENLSILPKNYALDFSPGWIFAGKYFDYSKLKSNNIFDNIAQTTSISFGTTTSKNADSVEGTSVGIGIKTSLFRGKLNKQFAQKELERSRLLKEVNTKFDDIITEFRKKDTLYNTYDTLHTYYVNKMQNENNEDLKSTYFELKELYNKLKQNRIDSIVSITNDKKYQEKDSLYVKLKKAVSEIDLTRVGFKLDIAMGIAVDFPDRIINNSKITKGGLWVTSGYESDNNWSWLFVGKLFAAPKQEIETSPGIIEKKTILNSDVGTKIILDAFKSFSFSGELIYRRFFNENIKDKDEIKYVLNANYELDKNITLAFSLGKDFETNLNTNGNLIVALNLIMGFGNERPIFQKTIK